MRRGDIMILYYEKEEKRKRFIYDDILYEMRKVQTMSMFYKNL